MKQVQYSFNKDTKERKSNIMRKSVQKQPHTIWGLIPTKVGAEQQSSNYATKKLNKNARNGFRYLLYFSLYD